VGIVFGVGVLKLEVLDGLRSELAGWLMLAFGLAYFVWGVRRAIRCRPHRHSHVHADGTMHSHEHIHTPAHLHVHASSSAITHPRARGRRDDAASITPWILFTIFLFGPCEPLIPLMMYTAGAGTFGEVVLVTLSFAAATLATMTAVVLAVSSLVVRAGSLAGGRLGGLERYSHALAGFVVLLCGVAVKAGL
jgi:ABC-type nickel/cobalt efflux system permease component RcnA